MAGNVPEVTEQNFESEVIRASQPVLVDFWAPWCGPCRQIAPILEQLATENAATKVVKVNVDESPNIAAQYNVHSIPTLILFKGGAVFESTVGLRPKSQLQEMLARAAT
jgi:thioredoxin 1